MAVTECNAKNAKGSFPAGGGAKYTVTYEVKTDDRGDGPQTVRNSSLVPGPTSTYTFGNESNSAAFRAGLPDVVPVKAEGSLKLWRVTIVFQTPGSGSFSGARLPQIDTTTEGVEFPWDLPAEISGDFDIEKVERWYDRTGEKILNSAKRFLDPPVMYERTRPTLVIRRAYAPGSFNLSMLADFINTVNSSVFFCLGPDIWRLVRAPWQRLFMAGYAAYYNVSYEFQADPDDKWAISPPDVGYEDINGAWPEDVRGVPMPGTLGQLDGSGVMLGPYNDTFEEPILLDGSSGAPGPYYVYHQRDFALLGVPTSIS